MTEQRAIVSGKIATVKNGKRIVKYYNSNQKLEGTIPANDAPPYTGYVRGWFRKRGKK